MKKLSIILLILLLLCGCSSRSDYFDLGIDDYSITVGYDDCEYLKLAYDFDVKQQLAEKQVIDDVNIYLFDDLLGVGQITNPKNKVIENKDGILSKLVVYLNDLNGRKLKLNSQELDESIKTNCDSFNGTYVEKNGYACIIENNVDDKLNVVELYGDYLNIDQDKLDHIVIYVK